MRVTFWAHCIPTELFSNQYSKRWLSPFISTINIVCIMTYAVCMVMCFILMRASACFWFSLLLLSSSTFLRAGLCSAKPPLIYISAADHMADPVLAQMARCPLALEPWELPRAHMARAWKSWPPRSGQPGHCFVAFLLWPDSLIGGLLGGHTFRFWEVKRSMEGRMWRAGSPGPFSQGKALLRWDTYLPWQGWFNQSGQRSLLSIASPDRRIPHCSMRN